MPHSLRTLLETDPNRSTFPPEQLTPVCYFHDLSSGITRPPPHTQHNGTEAAADLPQRISRNGGCNHQLLAWVRAFDGAPHKVRFTSVCADWRTKQQRNEREQSRSLDILGQTISAWRMQMLVGRLAGEIAVVRGHAFASHRERMCRRQKQKPRIHGSGQRALWRGRRALLRSMHMCIGSSRRVSNSHYWFLECHDSWCWWLQPD